MFCPNCGQKIEKKDGGVLFCPYCGSAFSASEEPTVPAASPAAVAPAAPAPQPQQAPKKKGKKLWIAILAVVCAVAILLGIWLIPSDKDEGDNVNNAPEEVPEKSVFSIEDISVEDRNIQTYQRVTRKVSVEVKEGSTYTGLDIVDADAQSIGTIKDDGANGDDVAGDGIYSGVVEFYSEVAEPMLVYAAFEGAVSDKSETVYFYPEYKPEFYAQYVELDDAIADVVASNSDLEVAHNEIMELLNTKQANGEIVSFSFANASITVKMNSGATYVYMYNPGNEYKAGSAARAAEVDEMVGLYTMSPNINKVLTLQPYRHELGAGGVDDAANSIADSQYGFTFSNNADNESVSVELMKTLNQYQVVLLDGHGGNNGEHHSFFGIGTLITDANNAKYWADLYYDRLIGLSGGQYGVTSAFFDFYYEEDDFGDAIIYLGCCHGADDNVLVNTLLSKGVDAVFAYRNSVSVSYDANMVKKIFKEMAAQKDTPVTVSTALSKAKDQYGKYDNSQAHWYNWLFGNYQREEDRAQLCLFTEQNNVTLKMENSSLCGKVADASTKSPVQSASVTAYMTGTTKAVATVKTDAAGNFVLALDSGRYDVLVRSVKHLTCMVSNVEVGSNATTYLQNTILLEQRETNVIAAVGGTISNAVTGEGVEGASISFRNNQNQMTGDYVTDASGNVITAISGTNGIYYADGLAYGYYTAEISKEGYVTQYVNVVASDDNDIALDQNVVLSPEASGSDFRITLEWEENPRDEDAHIVCEDFHVYFSNKNAYKNGDLVANLDHDDRFGNGFETITLTVDPNKTYKYYVYHYAGTGSLSTSNAIVKVYQGGVMIKQYNVPVDQGTGDYWNVFNIVDGKVVSINRISDSSDQ